MAFPVNTETGLLATFYALVSLTPQRSRRLVPACSKRSSFVNIRIQTITTSTCMMLAITSIGTSTSIGILNSIRISTSLSVFVLVLASVLV